MHFLIDADSEETWKDVVSYENYFSVSDQGRIFNKRNGRIHKQGKLASGYRMLTFSIEGKYHNKLVHRAVAQAFLNNKNSLPCVNHKDGNKANNNVSNLEWITYSGNTKHALETGLSVTPSKDPPSSKVSQKLLKEISAKVVVGCKENGLSAWSRRLGVSRTTLDIRLQRAGYR